MSIKLSDSIRVGQQKPLEDKYFNELVPYTSTSQVNTLIPKGVRHIGLTVNVNKEEYWYKDGIEDSNLVLKITNSDIYYLKNQEQDNRLENIEGENVDQYDLINYLSSELESERTRNDIQDSILYNLEGINYTWSPTNRTLTLYDREGTQLSQVSLVSLDNEGTDIRYNASTLSLELYNADNELLDSIPVSSFIGSVGTQLQLNSNQLQLKDSQGNILSTVTFAVSNIDGLQTVLNSKLDKGTYTGTAQDLKNDIDNIQIGGRNLFLESEAERNAVFPMDYNKLSETLIEGKEYNISFEIKGVNNGHFFLNPSLIFTIPVNPNANEWFRVSKTFVYIKNDYLDRPLYPHIYNATTARKIKLEKGNKATDWTPAPEDKQDVLTEDNLGQFMDLELSTKLTPTSGDTVLARDILTNKAVEIPIESLGGGDTSNLVPYTGATQDVNIGAHYFESSAGFKTQNGTPNQALTANGDTFDLTTKADLENGKIPATQLPSYVDDVLEFANLASFPATGESGKVYIAIDTNLTYRWGGSSYVVMSSSLALGETSSTAYRGDRGKIAYDHSQTTGNPHGTTKNDIGLGNVPNLDTTNPANIIQSASYRFVTDAEKATWNGKASTAVATASANGLMSSADKTKLDGIAAGANNYTHPTGDGNSHIPATGTTNNGKVLKAGATSNSASWSNVDWSDIANKPATFTATVHTHSISEVTNLQTSLDSKVNTSDVVTTATANKILKLDANAKLPANITGNADGNAATATALQTARTLTIGNTGKSFDGSGNVSWSLAEIGAQSILTNPITGTGTTNYIPKFSASGTLANSIVYDNGTNVGIGTTTLGARLDVRAQGSLTTDIVFRVRNSADTQNFLVVNGAGDVYNRGAQGNQYSTFFGEKVGRNSTGIENNAFGYAALQTNTTGYSNSAFGTIALNVNTTGVQNSAFGNVALRSNTTGNLNSAFGLNALYYNTEGSNNSAFGEGSLGSNTTGNQNTALGSCAGDNIIGGYQNSTPNNSVFIGFGTTANANNETNQIVIGHSAIGNGSNSVTLGNDSITKTVLKGQVIMGSSTSTPTGIEGAIYYNSTTKKHYGFNGTSWNALY